MSLRRSIIKVLDRRGGRKLLGALTTAHTRACLKGNSSVVYDGQFWCHVTNGWCFPDSRVFDYHGNSAAHWSDQPAAEIRNAENLWYKLYRPSAGDVVIDVGAGRGEDDIAFSRDVGKTGRIIAVEANPESFRLLKRFVETNSLANVTPIHAAIVGKPGKVYVSEAEGGRWEADTVSSTGVGIEVDGLTLDQLCQTLGIGSVSFLKVNIEGAERDALGGMKDTLSMVRTICVCCHDFRADRGEAEEFRTRATVMSFLDDSGFKVRDFPYQYDFERDHIHASR